MVSNQQGSAAFRVDVYIERNKKRSYPRQIAPFFAQIPLRPPFSRPPPETLEKRLISGGFEASEGVFLVGGHHRFVAPPKSPPTRVGVGLTALFSRRITHQKGRYYPSKGAGITHQKGRGLWQKGAHVGV